MTEDLKRWAEERFRRREAEVGRLRAAPLGASTGRGVHLGPGAPRLISRWDGYQWIPQAVAEDYAAAQRILHPPPPPAGPGPERRPGPTPPGRHRKPPPV